MAYVINDGCIGCSACESMCPTNAITNAGDKCSINSDACIGCGACAGVCPVEAISEN